MPKKSDSTIIQTIKKPTGFAAILGKLNNLISRPAAGWYKANAVIRENIKPMILKSWLKKPCLIPSRAKPTTTSKITKSTQFIGTLVVYRLLLIVSSKGRQNCKRPGLTVSFILEKDQALT